MKTRLELVTNHMNAIAAFFGGWKDENINQQELANRVNILLKLEFDAHQASEVLCDGEGRGKGYYKDNKNANCEIAENRILEIERKVTNYLRIWCADPENKIRERFFINRDPRGYALKIRITPEENKTFNIYTDWGGYGIIVPKIEHKVITDENKNPKIIWFFE